MKVLFDYHELWDVVENGVSALDANATEAQRVAHRDQKKKDKKALYLIHQGMNDETFEKIEGATTASEAWTILSTSYKGDDKIKRVRLQTLRRQYELLQMEATCCKWRPPKLLNDYISKVLAPDQSNEDQRFEHVVAAIEEANDLSTMTVRLLSGSLRAHEQRMNDNKIEKPIEQALQAQLVAPLISTAVHEVEDADVVVAIPTKVVVARTMEVLSKTTLFGHYANECRSKGDNQAINCAQEDRNHDQDEGDHALLMVATSNETPNYQTWYLDTGCTNNMCGYKELFTDLDESFHTRVKFGDGRFVPVTGKGRILITMKNGDHSWPKRVM
ncbi:uncharacterized protein LOC119370507 [Jatropha curcas]|uniref:uncharacterized protein LOC119370507 n=1 Tax=Jatropha curcas TaxID=180498 RepID=UPI0018945571|nr:uncharacterized protein LOC119370507 [Jatropha curcas]